MMKNLNPLTIDEIHKETLCVLRKFIAICDEIKVDYFVAYGSLIGAVRHQGFIPWDDDFDVFMVRPEYDKFVDYCNNHAEKLLPFKLMNKENTPVYPFNISRFNDTRFRMESDGYPDAGMGVFIDIYPLDGLGNDSDEAKKKFCFKKKLYMKLWGLKIAGKFKKSTKGIIKTAIKWLVYNIITFCDYDFFFKKLDELKDYYEYDKSKYVGLVVWEDNLIVYEKSSFEGFNKLLFEGIEVKVPRDYLNILETVYGDFMKLPPDEQRKPTHNYSIYRKINY